LSGSKTLDEVLPVCARATAQIALKKAENRNMPHHKSRTIREGFEEKKEKLLFLRWYIWSNSLVEYELDTRKLCH
jgi:hypothetical protein